MIWYLAHWIQGHALTWKQEYGNKCTFSEKYLIVIYDHLMWKHQLTKISKKRWDMVHRWLGQDYQLASQDFLLP